VSSAPGASGDFDITIDDVSWIGPKGSASPPAEPGAPRFARALVPDDPAPLHDLPWRELARDDAGDARPGLPDGRALFVAKDPGRPLVWFRIDLEGPMPAHWIGVNLVLDVDGDPANGTAWWGKNTTFHFDRLVTAWVFQVGNRYEGSVGIVSADEAAAFRVTNDREVHLALDRAAKRVYLAVPASELEGVRTRLVAAVGSAMVHSDDLPDVGAVELGAALTRAPRGGPVRGADALAAPCTPGAGASASRHAAPAHATNVASPEESCESRAGSAESARLRSSSGSASRS